MILGLLSHDGSMGRTILPTWMVDFYGINVAKYTVRPMDPMGIAMESFPKQASEIVQGRIRKEVLYIPYPS